MKISVFYGDTKRGIETECGGFEEAEKLIRECAEKPAANITFNVGKLPNIELKINGDFAYIIYDGKIEKRGGRSDGADDEDDEFGADNYFNANFYYPTWVTRGTHNQPVKFLAGHFKKMRAVEAQRIITLEQAIACVKEFFDGKKRAEGVKWERML